MLNPDVLASESPERRKSSDQGVDTALVAGNRSFGYACRRYATAVVKGKVLRFKLSPALAVRTARTVARR
jgi:hypothetical protein